MAEKILVVDDDPGIRDAVRMILEYEGYQVLTSPDGKTALADLDSTRVDAVLLDIKMPGLDGFEILDRIVSRESPPPVLMISGHGDIATAIEATRRGAVDFLEKPPQRERILVSIKNALARNTLRAENERLRHKLDEESVLVGHSAPMVRLREEVARAAPTAATVLIQGESGTGKELVARAIHVGSPRAGGMFLPYNCTTTTRELADSQLFGHRRGSFTGAVNDQPGLIRTAAGGTLFLDEIGDVPLEVQSADRPAGQNGNDDAGACIDGGHLPAEQADEQDDRHLVHHRRRDEERERDAQRYARLHEPDEQRHGGAGAERRDNA
jgi:two-component system nitrogen regulation response regulator NtrX